MKGMPNEARLKRQVKQTSRLEGFRSMQPKRKPRKKKVAHANIRY